MYERIETFIRKRDDGRLSLDERGKSISVKNSFTGRRTDLNGYIAWLISEYRKVLDAIDGCIKNFSTNNEFLDLYEKASMRQFHVAKDLLQAIEYAYSYNIVNEKPAQEADELKQRAADLETDLQSCREENKRLQANLAGLQRLLARNLQFETNVEHDNEEGNEP
jgi:predicted RNase H-like nuclease (RuvC/YqgF family)